MNQTPRAQKTSRLFPPTEVQIENLVKIRRVVNRELAKTHPAPAPSPQFSLPGTPVKYLLTLCVVSAIGIIVLVQPGHQVQTVFSAINSQLLPLQSH